MESSAHAILSQWESFYVIVGSSGAALTGLMFVVITLAADSNVPRTPETVNAFASPNVISSSPRFSARRGNASRIPRMSSAPRPWLASYTC